ncbi:hypothetical protein H7X87_01265 [Acetobacteraceae bacterium]|nr:hypothetical protein [Candidatus Parcubacteria bacterium]
MQERDKFWEEVEHFGFWRAFESAEVQREEEKRRKSAARNRPAESTTLNFVRAGETRPGIPLYVFEQ